MENLKVSQEEKTEEKYGASIGTWFSLGIVLAVITATNLLLFWLYMARV
ncbi:hypothetical protein [Evansella tamaricis]|uniref:Cytochrome c oxidase subunit 2A n=1 Tax=Evansella tamaricis TaxID=2069301 RepID=A0ABS6JC07_9BACI|nr:hypothetical protein [Evansella tamaricis]MBU9710377.1 hypothetical protein [Evansella tamaricis]